jgi:DNA repair protein RadC
MSNKYTLPKLKLTIENPFPNADRITVRCADDAVNIFRDIWEPDTMDLYESVYILFLNRASRVIGFNKHSIGSISGSIIDVRLVFATALLSASTSIIVGHNHPSGNLNPSSADEHITKLLTESGTILHSPRRDHIIITSDSFFSFGNQGML